MTTKTWDNNIESEFKQLWNPQWNPINHRELMMDKDFDVLGFISNRVVYYNESWDISILGGKGIGKSSTALGIAKLLNSRFNVENNVCFNVDEWVERTNQEGVRGQVFILDEVGTEGSLSSRTSMKRDNRSSSDIVQLNRTEGVITIYVTIDDNRIDKRVRETTSVLSSPIKKLGDDATGGMGFASQVDIRYRVSYPAKNDNKDEYLTFGVKGFKYSSKGRVKSIIVPHPPISDWLKYESLRNEKLAQVRMNAQLEIKEKTKAHEIGNRKK